MRKNPRKPQRVFKTLEKTQGPQERTQDSIEKPKILGKNPRSRNADYYHHFAHMTALVNVWLPESLDTSPHSKREGQSSTKGNFQIYTVY